MKPQTLEREGASPAPKPPRKRLIPPPEKLRAAGLEAAISLLAFVLSIVTGGIILAILGVNPFTAYAALFQGALGSPSAIGGTINRMIPIILAGLAVAVGQKGSVFNIGVEGQLIVGGLLGCLAGIYIPAPAALHLPICMLASMLGGLLWALIPAWLRLKKNVGEVFTTIMFNYVAKFLLGYLVVKVFVNAGGQLSATEKIRDSARLPALVAKPYNINVGILVAVLAVVLVAIFIQKTRWGYEMRATGYNRDASSSAGINVGRNMFLALLLSGALAGLGGCLEINGTVFRVFESYSPGYGATGIAVALLAKNNPVAVLLTAFLFGAMRNGAALMQMSTGVSSEFVSIVQGLIIIFVCSENFIRYLLKKAQKRGVKYA
ncbi:ABC transporter permease [Bittarella massiliensis (ex Durand et al. 2017)]|uniref:ABC transporter permease n=1 Tax=Bittarella massiliensis (ex Durand et al. 2017) TaxID=1720313 RepID=UPI001AA0F7DB|nr:ABC transporter permease [Bittarella massiliensis (ex Durand et al. 2017)]MBO1680096.1 ABC transporter permease [Bittarella massiliensis (ex Durand et al. 2017)]